MNFNLSGGTAQQRQWFNDAIDGMTLFPFDNFATAVTVTWVAESVLQSASHAYGRFTFALTTYHGDTDTATLQIFEGLDTRTDDQFQGHAFYMETVAHEVGHVVSGHLDDQGITDVCSLFDEGFSSWLGGGWEQRIAEGVSEIIKDAYLPARKFDNRTTRFIHKERFDRLIELLNLVIGISSGTTNVLGAPLGDYNAPGPAWGAGGGPGPGWIYGLTLAEPGQPVLLFSAPQSYDYVLLQGIDRHFDRPHYPFVYFFDTLVAPHNWKLTLHILAQNFDITGGDPIGHPPNPGDKIARFIWLGIDKTIFGADLSNIVEFTPGRWSADYIVPDADAVAIALACMNGDTPFFTWRDYTGWRGFNDNEPSVPYDGLSMTWSWLAGGGSFPPWPYQDPELGIGQASVGIRPKKARIVGPQGPVTSLR